MAYFDLIGATEEDLTRTSEVLFSSAMAQMRQTAVCPPIPKPLKEHTLDTLSAVIFIPSAPFIPTGNSSFVSLR